MLGLNELLSNASLQIYEYGIHVRDEMWFVGRVFPFYVMSYIQNGQAELRVNGESYRLGPRSVILIPPEVKHDHIKVGDVPAVFMWWHFDYKLHETLDLLRLLGLPMVFQLAQAESFEDTFAKYNAAMELPVTLQNTILKKASALAVMAQLLGAAEEARQPQLLSMPENFREMLETILACREPELSLKVLAERYNMHPTYLSNRFKQYYGVSPIALHRKMLLKKAKDMLGVQGMSVGDVAEALGFTSVSVFSRFFTAKMGMAPSHVVRNGRQQEDSEQF